MTDQRLQEQVAVVTGAGNGIGRACALALGANGATVVVNDLGTNELGTGSDHSAADRTVKEIVEAGGAAIANYDSVAEFDSASRIIATAVDTYGRLDVLVNCAGAVQDGSIFDLEVDTYLTCMAVQLHGQFYTARQAAPIMAAQGRGRIINTASHLFLGDYGKPAFAAAKGGVVSLTAAIATEGRAAGITCNAIAPGAATRLHAYTRPQFEAMRAEGVLTDEMWESYVNTPPPEYVAPIVAWLATDAAADITGRLFHAAGGTIGIFSIPIEERVIYRGDHRRVDPWTLEELDALVPAVLVP
jgi:NAD(P)-dependent dehydrogenase (short-subunit alcohol dehydrogenase family)